MASRPSRQPLDATKDRNDASENVSPPCEKEAGFTQEALAEPIGVAPTTISRLERGVTSPSLRTLERLAAAVRVEVRDLLDFTAADTTRDRVVESLVRDLQQRSADEVLMVRELVAMLFKRKPSRRGGR